MNDINNLISEELGKMSQLFHYQRGKVISEQAKDETSLTSYPACVQKLAGVKIRQAEAEVFAKTDSGPFSNYRFYYNGMYSGPNKKKGRYSCSGTEILIDGKKLTTTSTTYPKCVTNQDWGEPITSAKGQTYIKGGEMTTADADYTGYAFYNNNRVLTPKKVLKSYKCSPDNTVISVFLTPAKAPAATTPNTDEATRVKMMTSAWCREKDGIINWTGSQIDKMKWADYYDKYVKTDILFNKVKTAAQTACPNKSVTTVVNDKVSDTSKVNTNKQKRQVVKQQVASINQEIQKSIGSTNPTGSLSDAEIQQLITKFGGTV
jgi:hypothetical protein